MLTIQPNDVREEVDLENVFGRTDELYVLRVRGGTMKADHLVDGDRLIVKPARRATDGKLALVQIDGEAADVRRYYRDPNGMVRLIADGGGTGLRVLPADRVIVLGIVVGMVRA